MKVELRRWSRSARLTPVSHPRKIQLAVAAMAVTVVFGYMVLHFSHASGGIGDLNGDGTVNILDLSILLSDWGTSNATADLNSDGTVSIFDLSILLSHWGQQTGAPVVPASEQICGSSQLQSPWSGSGVPAGELTGGGDVTYTSGQYAGLPTFGSAGTDFPNAHTGVIVAAGSNNIPDYAYGANTVFWFAPGTHTTFGVEAEPTSDYVGGYANGTMATLNGGGSVQFAINDENGHFGAASNGVTVEYLDMTNYNPTETAAGVFAADGSGWTVNHNYIHDFGGESGGSAQGTGAFINNGSVSYNCMRNLGQVGVNFFGSNDVIAYNEFDHDGTFADNGGTNAGIKGWETLNADINHNYFHNAEYGGHGIWLDTSNTGYHIWNNFFAWNAGRAVEAEISYNGMIEGNTFEYNGWSASSGSGWDSAAIYLNLTGGANIQGSNYNNEVVIQNNTLWDNWEGIAIFSEGDRTCIQPQPYSTYCPVLDNTSFSAFSNPSSGGDSPGNGAQLAAAASAGATTITTNFQYALGDKIGFASSSFPYKVVSATGPSTGPNTPPNSGTWTIGISPGLSASQASGAAIYAEGSCIAEMPSNATPSGPSPQSLGLGTQTISYFEGCQWRPKNITVQTNTIHFSPTEIQNQPPPALWGTSWPLSFGGDTLNPATCYSGPNYLDLHDNPPTGNGTHCGMNIMIGSVGSPNAPYSAKGGEWLENAIMSNSSLPAPLNNLSAANNDFGTGQGESPANISWIGNTYDGPIGFRAYQDTVSATSTSNPPYACLGVGAIAGFTPICDVTVAQWTSIWHQN